MLSCFRCFLVTPHHGLNVERSSQAPVTEHLVPSWWQCFATLGNFGDRHRYCQTQRLIQGWGLWVTDYGLSDVSTSGPRIRETCLVFPPTQIGDSPINTGSAGLCQYDFPSVKDCTLSNLNPAPSSDFLSGICLSDRKR